MAKQITKPIAKSIFYEFLGMLKESLAFDYDNEKIATMIIDWIKDNAAYIKDTSLDKEDRILDFKNFVVKDYPVAFCDNGDIKHSFRNFIRLYEQGLVKFDSSQGGFFSMKLREFLDYLFCLRVDGWCDRCREMQDFSVIKCEKNIACECRVCGFIQGMDKGEILKTGRFTVPTIYELKELGFID